ncbi:hypothetical protein ACHQM5_021925 [Ranunculus cassubicifolius]
MAARKKVRVTRNPDLIRVGKYLRSQMYHKRAKPAEQKPVEKAPKFYPAEDVKKPLVNKHKPKPTKLRASITPRTVLIILAGRFKGTRVVFLNQLASGLLLVTGSFKINSVPLRRVNQAYVIATSTKVDLVGLDISKYDDSKYFAKQVEKKKKKKGEEKKDDQKTADAALLKTIEAIPDLKTYLETRFSLKSGMKPHELLF